MVIRLTLDRRLVERLREVAAKRNTTLSSLVREHLKKLVAENTGLSRSEMRATHAALERSFRQIQFKVGPRTWKRENLYERS